MDFPFKILLSGFSIGGSLIVAIGAQNAFILRQGVKRSFVFPVVALCTLIDWILIMIGALGFGYIIASFPLLTSIAAWGGATFLLVYGFLSFRSAIKGGVLDTEEESVSSSEMTLRKVILTTLAVSLLNPHVYLDTVVLLGGIAAQYEASERLIFALGAEIASGLWFFGLGYGARLLAPLFLKPRTWRILDVLIGIVMWWIAASLILSELA